MGHDNFMKSGTIMATPIEAGVNITSCPICFETFNNPKYLPCLHSFCEGCLQSYITSAFKVNSDSKGINCPMCRAFVQKPESVDDDDWAKAFPSNHLLVSIIDINKAKSGSQSCKACARDNETTTATSWCVNCCESLCESCVRHHRRNKQTYQHKIDDIANLMKDTGSSLQQVDLNCTEHLGKILEAFCYDHSVVCCMTCVMLKHRKCDNVQSVEKAAELKKLSEEYNQLEKSFSEMKTLLENTVEIRRKNIIECEKSISNMKTEINKLFDNFIQHVGQIRDKTLQEINVAEKEVMPNLESDNDELKCKISAIDNAMKVFYSNAAYAPPAQYLQAMENLSEQCHILEKDTKDKINKLENITINYKPNEKILEMTKSFATFGTVSVNHERCARTVSSSNKVIHSTHLLSCTPTLLDDTRTGDYTRGLVFLEDGRVLITKNNTIEIWNDKSTVVATLSVPGFPSYETVRMINASEGAIAIYTKALLFFRISNNSIKEVKRVAVPVIHDFIYHKGKFFIGSHWKIIVQDSSNQHIRDIATENNVGYIAARDADTLCYTTYGGSVLHCITMEGKPVFQYSHGDLKGTWGVTVDKVGNIYVCGFDSRNIHQLNRNGKLQRIMFDNLPSGPNCIGFDKDHHYVVIGCDHRVLSYKLL